jgi:mono/diheme cytochrome c family protein
VSPQRMLNVLCIALACILLAAAAADSNWLARVPEKDRNRSNPLAADSDATLVGAKLFQQHCAACHGANAEGKNKHPNLHSDPVKTAQPGELQWLLTNGSLRRGMPSWSRLPEQQRWQLVAYLKTLK